MMHNAIDSHAHLFDVAFGSAARAGGSSFRMPDVLDLFEMSGYRYLINERSPLAGFMERLISVAISRRTAAATKEGIVSSMSRSGIRISVVHPVFPHVTTSMVYEACDFGALFPFCSPPVGTHGFLEEAQRDLDRGCLGVKIHPLVQGRALLDPDYAELLSLCAKAGKPMLTHFGGSRAMFGAAPEGHGKTGDLVRFASRSKDAALIVGHCGLWQNEETLDAIWRLDNAYADTSFQCPGFIKKMVRRMGAHRVLLGSDHPIGGQASSVRNVMAAGLSDGDTEAVLSGNALGLFGFRAARAKWLAINDKNKTGENNGQK